jgi:hypothetical protein
MLNLVILVAGEAKNAGNTVVLARLFNEASGQKVPIKCSTLILSEPEDGNNTFGDSKKYL